LNAGYAYIVSGNHAKLTVINVSTPSSPVKYTAISLTGGAGNEDICFHGTKAYSSGVLTGTIDVIDISNPQIPVLGTPITGLSSPRKLCISGDYLFVTNSGANELRIFNISGTPSYVSTVGGLNDCYAVSVQGKYAYVVNYGSNTLSVIDISSITSPVVVGTASVGTNPYDLAVAGQYVYVANFTSMTISVVDVSNPTAPNTIATTAAVASYSSLSVSGISTFGSIESRNYSDLFKSDQGDLQRTAVYSLELKRKRIKGLKRWSGVYLQNTFKNDLNQNDYADYDESNETFGGITRIFEYGDILKVLQSEKVTSYYLSKAVLNQAAQSGTEIVSTSTLVLGSMHQSTERYGCQNAESLVQNGTTSYYADVNNGCFIREGTSEPVPISDNGIKNYTKALFDQIKNYYPRIVGGYDQSKGELWYTIYAYMPTGEIKITLMFNEEEKTWKSYFDFVDVGGNIPEMYGSIGQVMFAFVQGITWQHESGTDYSNFFGIDVQPKVNIVAKGNGKSVFNSVKLISNKNWKCDSVLVFDNNTYQAGMVSKLPAFVKKEGWLYAPFLRDMTTSSPTPTNNDLFNGRSLRGMTAEFELQTIESGLTQLYEVEVTTTPSL
jgi:DNA-binding beta-propeller fold protein YncE